MLLLLFLFLRDTRGRLMILDRLRCVTVKQFELEKGRARHHTQGQATVILEEPQYQGDSGTCLNGIIILNSIKMR